MTRKKKQILEDDSTLRLIYAFNHFTSENDTWEFDSYTTVHNRKIFEQMGIIMDDAYFIFGGLFYSFNYQRVSEDIISCEVKEYDNFYDLATTITIMKLNFNVTTKEVEILEEKTKIIPQSAEQYQKMMKVA